jgi:hypothetical protein
MSLIQQMQTFTMEDTKEADIDFESWRKAEEAKFHALALAKKQALVKRMAERRQILASPDHKAFTTLKAVIDQASPLFMAPVPVVPIHHADDILPLAPSRAGLRDRHLAYLAQEKAVTKAKDKLIAAVNDFVNAWQDACRKKDFWQRYEKLFASMTVATADDRKEVTAEKKRKQTRSMEGSHVQKAKKQRFIDDEALEA